MFKEREPQFFKEEARGKAPERKIEGPKEDRLGKRAELEIVNPLFDELKNEKIIEGAWKTSKEVDEKLKVDFVVGLDKSNFVAVDACIADIGAKRGDTKIWEGKLKRWGDNPLRPLGQIHPDYEEKYKKFFGPSEKFSRLELIAIQKERAQATPEELNKLKEKVPIICLYLSKEEMENAFDKFDLGGTKTAVDALYSKDRMKLKILEGIAVSLSQYLVNEEFVKKYKLEKLRPFIMPKYQRAVEGAEDFFQALQKEPKRLGNNEVERKITVNKTNQFLEQHRAVLKKLIM